MSHHLPLPNRLDSVDHRHPHIVDVRGSARLHFGFAVPSAIVDSGRRFGSIGLRVEAPAYDIRFYRGFQGPNELTQASLSDDPQLRQYVAQIKTAYGLDFDIEAEVRSGLVRHAGLGSGTQLALAAGVGACGLAGVTVGATDIATQLQRGVRSGIGVAAFEHGGLIVDGGHQAAYRSTQSVPPVLARAEFPDAWAIILIRDSSMQGKAGANEQRAFDALPDDLIAQSAEVCRLVMMQLLPAVAEDDFVAFTDAVTGIQRVNGDYFAPVQGGRRFASAQVEAIAEWLTRHGAAGCGQSSWGPTGYVFCENRIRAEQLVTKAKQRLGGGAGKITLQVTRGCNEGATIIPRRLPARNSALIKQS